MKLTNKQEAELARLDVRMKINDCWTLTSVQIIQTLADRDAQIAELREQADLRVAAAYRDAANLLVCESCEGAGVLEAECPCGGEDFHLHTHETFECPACEGTKFDLRSKMVLSRTPASAQAALDAHDRKIAEEGIRYGFRNWMGRVDAEIAKAVDDVLAACKAGGGL